MLTVSDMDKLVSIKGLVIRTTPIIPDMKEGKISVLVIGRR
jgi:DNA replicative helicase MCM subunit Mcm2 (Cdc46/Mcm family)